MELIKEKEREWMSKSEAIRGTIQEISQKINQINAQPNRFVIATHQPILINKHIDGEIIYETIIFYKEKIMKTDDAHATMGRELQR